MPTALDPLISLLIETVRTVSFSLQGMTLTGQNVIVRVTKQLTEAQDTVARQQGYSSQ